MADQFDVIGPNAEQPEEVILSFSHEQGKYIKTLPLHETQEILLDNNDELQVKLTLFLTEDFLMEILSHGDSVKVLKPEKLVNQVSEAYWKASIQYNQSSKQT